MNAGRTACEPCEAGKYSVNGATSCQKCASAGDYTDDKINCKTCPDVRILIIFGNLVRSSMDRTISIAEGRL